MSIQLVAVTSLVNVARQIIETINSVDELGQPATSTHETTVFEQEEQTNWVQVDNLQDDDENALVDDIAEAIVADHQDDNRWFADPLNEGGLADFLQDGPALRDFVLSHGGDLADVPAVAAAVIELLDPNNSGWFKDDDRDDVLGRLPVDPGDPLPANPSVDEARCYLAMNPPLSNDPLAWTSDQLSAFSVLGNAFGRMHTQMHEEWHAENGPGGTEGPGSGTLFLDFHREMMVAFEEFAGIPIPDGWDPSSFVPPELLDPDPTGNPRNTTDTSTTRPNWLTLDGNGDAAGNANFGPTVTIDGVTYDSLDDFTDPDQLGRALGMTPYHASVHSEIGGVMSSFASPQDPAFYLWHGHIDSLIDEWLATPNGQTWAAANPSSPLLTTEGLGGHH